jgi:hypothetical protein
MDGTNMEKIIGQDFNATTGEITPIYSTPEYEAYLVQAAEEAKAIEEANATKAEARAALLKRLKITEEEAQLLLGGN